MVYNIYTDDSLIYRFIVWQLAHSDHLQLNQGFSPGDGRSLERHAKEPALEMS